MIFINRGINRSLLYCYAAVLCWMADETQVS